MGKLVQELIHAARGLGVACRTHRPGRHARHGRIGWHRLQNDRACGNQRARPDLDVAENFRASADHDAAPDLRLPVAGFAVPVPFGAGRNGEFPPNALAGASGSAAPA